MAMAEAKIFGDWHHLSKAFLCQREFLAEDALSPPSTRLSEMPLSFQAQVTQLLIAKRVFDINEAKDVEELVPFLHVQNFPADAVVFGSGSDSSQFYVLFEGQTRLKYSKRDIINFEPGATFGEVGFLEQRKRRGAVVTTMTSTVLHINKDELFHESFPQRMAARILYFLGKRLTTLMSGFDVYRELDVLIVQDGGSGLGSNPVTGYLTEYFDSIGRRVYAAGVGFKSLVSGYSHDFAMLVDDREIFSFLSLVPNVVLSQRLKDMRGAMFRTERFPEFKDPDNQMKAAQTIIDRKVKTLITIGGNGTFAGTRELANRLPAHVQVFFIPATIDSDVRGTECLGQHSAVEMGAEKLRCYLSDARTHDRAYLIEMMGRDGGFHCLHSCLGAGTHLAVMPNSQLDLPAIARTITRRRNTVIAVAEGYRRKEREAAQYKDSAANWLLAELRATGELDEKKKKVVTEPFSRDIRGCNPNNVDLVLSRKMAMAVVEHSLNGDSRVMPTVNGDKIGHLTFEQIETDNTVNPHDVILADRLRVSFLENSSSDCMYGELKSPSDIHPSASAHSF